MDFSRHCQKAYALINLEKAQPKSRYFGKPSEIEANGEVPASVVVRSIFCAGSTHFDRRERLSGRLYTSKEQAATFLNSKRSYGVGFKIYQVPLMIISYQGISIGVHTYRKYSSYGYGRLLADITEGWPDFWKCFPDLDVDWLRCFPIKSTPLKAFPEYRKEAFSSYFVGADFPIQWEASVYPLESKHFDTFLHFCESISRLHKKSE